MLKYFLSFHMHISQTQETHSYEIVLNNTLKASNLPTIKIPSVPDSNKMLKIFVSTENETQKETYENIPEKTSKEVQEEKRITQEKQNQTQTLTGTELGL